MKLIILNKMNSPLEVAGTVVPRYSRTEIPFTTEDYDQYREELNNLKMWGRIDYDLVDVETPFGSESFDPTNKAQRIQYNPEEDQYLGYSETTGEWIPLGGGGGRVTHFQFPVYSAAWGPSSIEEGVRWALYKYAPMYAREYLPAGDEAHYGAWSWSDFLGVLYWDLFSDNGNSSKGKTFEDINALVSEIETLGGNLVNAQVYSKEDPGIVPIHSAYAANALYTGIRGGVMGLIHRGGSALSSPFYSTSQFPFYDKVVEEIYTKVFGISSSLIDAQSPRAIWLDQRPRAHKFRIPWHVNSNGWRVGVQDSGGTLTYTNSWSVGQVSHHHSYVLSYSNSFSGAPGGTGPVLQDNRYQGYSLKDASAVAVLQYEITGGYLGVMLRPLGIDILSFYKFDTTKYRLEGILYVRGRNPKLIHFDNPNWWTSGGKDPDSHSGYFWFRHAISRYLPHRELGAQDWPLLDGAHVKLFLREKGTGKISALSERSLVLHKYFPLSTRTSVGTFPYFFWTWE